MGNNKVVYTCITGGYDNLPQPQIVYAGYDYICFSNSITESKIGIWEIMPIPYNNRDNTRLARFVKHNPHKVVSQYRYSVWIDSNIQILDNYLEKRVEMLIEKESVMAHIKHPYRDCIYEEALACVDDARDSFKSIYKLIRMLKKEKYPRHYGLTETNILYRDHNNPEVMQMSNQWWEIIDKFSKRDQLSCHYVLWKNSLMVDMLFNEGVNTYSRDHFKRVQHKCSRSYITRISVKAKKIFFKLIYLPFARCVF